MKIPLDFILERMKLYDPTEVLDLLDITTEEILSRFQDRIEERLEYIESEMEMFIETDDDSGDYDADNFNGD
jgi:hypothetical protein